MTTDQSLQTPGMNWKALEQSLVDSGRQALERLLEQCDGKLYAAAFHGSYREEEYLLSLPGFAASSAQALAEDHPDETDQSFSSSVKWNPADWRWDLEFEDYANTRLMALDDQLQSYANRARPKEWRAAERRFLVTVARAARTLGKAYSGHPGVTADFIVIFHDFGGDIALAKRSITRQQFTTIFPVELAVEETLGRVASLAEAEQADFYLSRLNTYQGISGEDSERWLISHGAAAQRGLLEQLDRKKSAPTVARILGLAGLAEPEVISALRRRALGGPSGPIRDWCARALGYLHDYDWLIEQDAELAVAGFCADFGSFRWKGVHAPVLDYRNLEHLLAQRPELYTAVEETMDGNSGELDDTAADLAQVKRALGLPYAAIRRHAASVLNNRDLAPQNCQLAIEALRSALVDDDEQVRLLAEHGLSAMTRAEGVSAR